MPSRTPSRTPGSGFSASWQRFKYFLFGSLLALKWGFIEIFTRHRKLDLEDLPKRPKEIAVVTGGTRGIGVDVVKKLLQCRFHVVLGCRHTQHGNVTVNKIRQTGVITGTAECLELDLSSLDSVRNFADAIVSKHERVHIVINNAGTMFAPYKITKDGLEEHFQTNFLSHFLMTTLLLPVMINTGATQEKFCRVVNTSGSAHFGGNLNFDDLQSSDFFSSYKASFDSKLAQVTMTQYLDRKLKEEGAKVHVYSVHPGMIPTSLWNNLGCMIRIFVPCLRLFLKNTDQGADGIVYAALSPDLENEGGLFLCNSRKVRPSANSMDYEIQERLWQIAAKLTESEDE